ncbi:pentatricopeptide repeat-containing protein At1g76280 isoform X2 [Ziziphus jujuba]|uniref:Pentatricopeptide repeat-containing protein At1g76280 isoform X2 n=1 Tax=Ziziphus jujuba TaxID=326968 RepID=A0ABM3IMU7_ZIZJJ|nr:pentatricopeptide repeat-containing protein At1g76280 isoform X2 [Ziziphus jujuba]
MCRALTRIPWRSIAGSYCKLKTHQHGWRSFTDKLVFGRALTTSQETTTKSMQMQIVHALRMGDRSKASSLLSSLGHGNYSLRADDFVDILTYCARSPDPLFVLETWRIMKEKEISLDNICSLLMLRALCKGGYLEEALNFINLLGDGISQISPIYNSFLGACAKMQNSTHANKCLDLMEQRLVGKNEVTYIQLLKLAVGQKNLSAVHQIWNDYIKHYSLSIISLRKFIWSFTRLGDLKSAYGILQQMVALAIRGSTSIYRSVEGKLLSPKLDIPIPVNRELGMEKLDPQAGAVSIPSVYCEKLESNAIYKEECAAVVFGIREAERMLNMYNSKPLMKVLRWSFSDVMHGCARLKNCELAEQLILQMQNLGLQPSSHTYDGFVRAVISERGFNFGMEVLKMMQKRDLKPYDPTLATLSISCSKALELDLAEDMLDQITEFSHPHPFNALLAACDTLDKPESAVRILAKMKRLKVRPDIRTYELLFSLFGNVNAPYEKGNIFSQVDAARRIKAIEMDMATNMVQHSHLSMSNLLRALGAEGMITELIQYLDGAKKVFSCNDTHMGTPIYNNVLHSLVEAKESDKAITIFKNMKSCGVLPDDMTYNIMIDCCSILRCFKSASALLSMMLRCGYKPQHFTYTALIKILLEDENFNEALNLLVQAVSERIQLDVLLFNTILQKACDKGMIDVIEFVVEQMHQEKIRPDTSTCNHVFSAYVDCGFHNAAMEALQVLTMRMVCEEDGSLPEMTEFGDDFILSEGSEVESRILQLFKDCEQDLAVALLNLRLSAIVGSSVSWSPNESPWAKRLSTLSTKYGTR